jgi:hypothetical protein
VPPDDNPFLDETPPEPPGPKLSRASDLVSDPEELDVGDWEPGNKYKGFDVVSRDEWPEDHEKLHGNLPRRFYVRSMSGQIGLVPWDGSRITWPWEQGWTQDLYRDIVESFLKEEPKKKEKK